MKLHHVLLAAVAVCLVKAVVAPGENLVLLLGLALGAFLTGAIAKVWHDDRQGTKDAMLLLGGWWLLTGGFTAIVTVVIALVLTIRST